VIKGDKMKVECWLCKKEYDSDDPDIVYRMIARSMRTILWGFECKACINKAIQREKTEQVSVPVSESIELPWYHLEKKGFVILCIAFIIIFEWIIHL